MPESFFNKVAGDNLQLYYETDFGKGVFLRILQNFYNNFFKEHIRVTASGVTE